MEEVNTIQVSEPPHNQSNEQQILATILFNDKLIREISDSINGKMFYDEYNSKIFTAMLYLYHSNMSIGYKTIIPRLQYKDPDNKEIIDYVLQLANAHEGENNFSDNIDLLKDDYQKRVLYNLYLKRVSKPLSGISATNLVKEVESQIDGMGISNNLEYSKIQDYADEWLVQLEDTTEIKQYKLGFKKIDELVLISPEDVMIIAARPSVGKSALSTNIVKNFCLQDYNPLFVSLEMSKKKFMDRLIADMANVKVEKLRRKKSEITSEEWSRIMVAKERSKKFDFTFYDKGGMSIEQLVGFCRYLKKKDKLDIVVIDYLQLLTSSSYKNQKQNQVGDISQKLKQLAMELSVPVIALSQLSRASVEHGKVREPFLSDLRDSGSLEQDADIVLMLHTEDINNEYIYEKHIDLFIRKNRDGKLGKVKMMYHGDYIRFGESIWSKTDNKYIMDSQENLDVVINDDDLPFN